MSTEGHTHDYAATSHSHSASQITAGTLPASAVASTGTDYTNSRIRNIKAGTTELTPGISPLSNGHIYIYYEQ